MVPWYRTSGSKSASNTLKLWICASTQRTGPEKPAARERWTRLQNS